MSKHFMQIPKDSIKEESFLSLVLKLMNVKQIKYKLTLPHLTQHIPFLIYFFR